jgi:hypothetical protein
VRLAVESGRDHDIAQDLNYRYLYHALFLPGSPEEQEALEDASAKCRDLQDTGDPAAWKNRCFLARIQAFSWYRQLLRDGNAPHYEADWTMRELLRLPGRQEWLRATVAKYLGALAAAEGDRSRSEGLFGNALSALEQAGRTGVLAMIRLTVCAEAWRSLHATDYLQEARALWDGGLAATGGNGVLSCWGDWLKAPETAAFPGLRYWY